MKKYMSLIKIQFKSDFCYRISTVAGIFVGIFQVLILYYIWSGVYKISDYDYGYSSKQLITYFVFSTVIYKLLEFGITLRISDLVRSGDIALSLLKPISFVRALIFESFGTLIASCITLVVPIVTICIVLFDMYIQKNILIVLISIVSFILAILIALYIDIIFGLLSFITENAWGLRVIRQVLMKLFSGALIPIAFMPKIVANIVNILPFKTLVDIPINIYLGDGFGSIVIKIGNQCIWLIIVVYIANVFYENIVKRIDINGG